MPIRIENVSGSLAFVRVKRILGEKPTRVKRGVKEYPMGTEILVATRDWPTDPDAESRSVAPGESMLIEDEGEFSEFDFDADDKETAVLACEDMNREGAEELVYRIVPSSLKGRPPKAKLH